MRKVKRFLASFFPNVEPSILTSLGLLLALIGAILLFSGSWMAIIFFAFSFLIDAIDGEVARRMEKTSAFGAFIDGVFDRIVEFLSVFPLMVRNVDYALYGSVFLFFGSALHSYLRAYADHRGFLKDVYNLPVLMPRAARVVGILMLQVLYFSKTFFEEFFLFLALSAVVASFYLFYQIIKRGSNA